MKELILEALTENGVAYQLVDDSDEIRLPCPECSFDKSRKFKFYFNTQKLKGQCWICESRFGLARLSSAFNLGLRVKSSARISTTFKRMTTLREALNKKAVSVKLPERTPLVKNKKAFKYVTGRDVSRSVIKLFGVYVCMDVLDRFYGRVIIPVKNSEGRSVSFLGRSLDPDEKVKYLFKKGVNAFDFLYGEDRIAGHEIAVIFEGTFSVLRTYELFRDEFQKTVIPLATFSHHMSAVQEETLRVSGIKKVLVFYDGDSESISCDLSARLSRWAQVSHVVLPVLDQPDDYSPQKLLSMVTEFVNDFKKTRLQKLPSRFSNL